MKEQGKKALQRQLTPMHVWAIAFGCIIGWGSFVNPGKKFLPNSGVAGTAIAMVLGAAVMVIIAFSYAYMIPKCPKAGGEFTFTKESFGKKTAFVCGWFLLAAYLTNVPMNSTAIGLIVDGLDGSADILKFGFHYTVAGFEIYFGEMIFATAILVIFAVLNMLGVQKAGFVQTMLSGMLVGSVFILAVSAMVSSKALLSNTAPFWGFDKAAAIAAGATTEAANSVAHKGTSGIISAILATFAIAPWAYVGFDTIPQAAEEFNFSYKKVIGIMVVAIAFGCFVYTTNNLVAAAALENWPERVMAGEWVLLVAAEEMLGIFGKLLIGIAVLSVPLLLVSLAIYMDDPGPVFFRQYRVGLHGKRFRVYKFRSMKTDTPKYLSTTEFTDSSTYVTRVGKFIRKFSIDELPQLINVLLGDMSLVGPRPLISDEYAVHKMRIRFGVYNIRPGITGWAQINGRDAVSAAEKVRYDVQYLESYGFWEDVKILFLTIPKIVKASDVSEGH